MRWRRYFRRRFWDDERAREIQSYIEIETDENLARGMPPDEARAAAHRKFGNPTYIREEIYRMNTVAFLESLWQDLRYALRSLRRSPGFAAAAVIILALGIGANTAVFSVADTAVFRPWPYKDPDRLVEIYQVQFRGPAKPMYSYGMKHSQWMDWRTQKQIFSGVEAMSRGRSMALEHHAGESIRVKCISPGMIDLLGIPLRLGRGFDSEQGQPGKDDAILLSEALWMRSFGSDPNVVGKTITLDNAIYTITGVVPRERQHLLDEAVQAWLPLVDRPGGDKYSNSTLIDVIGRIRPGLTFEQAQRETQAASLRFGGSKTWTAWLHKLNAPLGSESWRALFALIVVVGLLLLIACSNIANLLLSRADARGHETAIRAAIGAGRPRLMRQFLVESLVLAMGGSIGALCLASWGVRLLPQNLLSRLGFITVYEIELNVRVMLFTAAAMIVTTLLCGVLPALRATRKGVVDGLKRIDRTTGVTPAGRWLQHLLQVPQVALTLVLLCGTGVLAHSFGRLIWEDPGIDSKGLLTVDFSLPRQAQPGENHQAAVFEDLKARVRNLPGVRSVSIGWNTPPSTLSSGSQFVPEGQAPGSAPLGDLHISMVDSDFIPSLGLRILAGRNFDSQDSAYAPPVAIIDRRTAELAWPGQNAIGKRFADVDIRRLLKKTGGKAVDLRQFDQADYKIWRTIIGVAEAIKTQESVHSNVVCLAYVPLVQTTARTQARMMIRCSGETQSILAAARAQVSAVIEKSKIDKVATFDTIYSEIASGQKRTPVIYLALMSVFAATALLTAAIGILGVVSYSVNRRTAEIGIRVAMGARSRDVRRLLVKSMLPPVFAGITVGLIGSYWATRLFRSLLYQVKPFDPSTIFAASALMLLVALVAALLPARRATRVDPIAALRVE